MLKAFVDDSRENPVFLLGGYVAPAEMWAVFSERWREVLEIPPRLNYLKMKEACACRGEFEGWSEQRRDERLTLLHDVIEECASAAFVLAFDSNKFKKAFAPLGKLGKKNLNPYYFATSRLMVSLAQSQEELGLQGPIKFIFDDQLTEERHVVEAWDWAWTVAKPDPPNLRDIIGGAPSFEDDKRSLPLQAADMIAWWMRRRFVALAKGHEPIAPPWISSRASRVPAVAFQYNEQQLRDEALAIQRRAEIFDENQRKPKKRREARG